MYKGIIFLSRGCLQEKSSESTLFWGQIASSTGKGLCAGSHSKQQHFWGWFQAALHSWVDTQFFITEPSLLQVTAIMVVGTITLP